MSETRLEATERILRAAGELILMHFGRETRPREKEPGHMVTPADVAVDRMVIDQILQEFPSDRVFTEETGFVGKGSEYLWVVDPIDGTSNLTLGLPYVATCLAVQYGGETVLSGVYNPLLGEMFIAERGSGAFLNRERICVSDGATPSVGYYVQGYRVPPPVQLEILRVLLPHTRRVLSTWAPSLDWCSVACGRAEFLVGYDTEAEDLIQGKLILEEAGGRVTTWDNRPIHLDLATRQRVTLVATNGDAHQSLCALLDRASLGASLQGYRSSTEERHLQATLGLLSKKLSLTKDNVADRFSADLGLPRSVWERSADLAYLVTRADELERDPRAFLERIFDGVAPHLSGEMARNALVDTLKRVAEAWIPEECPCEIVAQALEISASDIRLHDHMQSGGYGRNIVPRLGETLPEDSFAVGERLKRNAVRKIRAVEGVEESVALEPVRLLADLALPTVERTCPQPQDGFAALMITAGRGTRLRTSVPKGLIPLGQRPMMNYTIDALQTAGASDIAVMIGYKGDLHHPVLIDTLVILEQTERLGTAHAVMMAKPYFAGYEGTLLISYSDMPFTESETLRAMIEKHTSESAMMTILTTSRENHPEFGRVFRREGRVCGIGQVRFQAVESDEVDVGFYCFRAPDFWAYLGKVQNANNRREFVLTEIVAHVAADGHRIETYFVGDYVQSLGINRPSDLIRAECIAHTRSKRDTETGPEAALYWKLRFYEAFGGIRADEIGRPPLESAHLEKIRAIVATYDGAVVQEVGPIFRCPDVLRLL